MEQATYRAVSDSLDPLDSFDSSPQNAFPAEEPPMASIPAHITPRLPRASANPHDTRNAAHDTIELLLVDHAEARHLIREYARAVKRGADATERRALARSLCDGLLVHMQLEDELFYPACRDAGIGAPLVDEAVVEHQTARELIDRIAVMHADDPMYDAYVKVLGEQVEHHLLEEERDIFPTARRRLDDPALLAAMRARRKGD